MGALRRAAFFALVVSTNGCRCNSVEDKELPPTPTAASSVAFKSDDCGPEIGGLESIASAPVVILGELHGLTSAPAFTYSGSCQSRWRRVATESRVGCGISTKSEGSFVPYVTVNAPTGPRPRRRMAGMAASLK